MKKYSVSDIARMAMYIALFVVMDFVSSKFIHMANGGSLGLGGVVLLLASFDLGYKKGILVTILGVVVSFLYSQPYFVRIDQFLIEYFVAFAFYGLGSLLSFTRPNAQGQYSIIGLGIGALLANILRFITHVLAGMIYWETGFWASMSYNSAYMIPTAIGCVILLPIIYVALFPLLRKNKSFYK